MAIAPQRTIIGIGRHFTKEGVHPYDEVTWELRDARITNFRDGVVAFEQLGVEVPSFWSVNATNILAQKYFRGTLGTEEREWSLKQVADRVVDTITEWGRRDGYFADDEEADIFSDELKHLIIHQKAAFNSPVWFNIGVKGVPQQGSACFILAVEDSMDSILNWYTEEGTIFKGGSGAGVNLSKIRSSHEHLKGGGTASGPVSFMRGADASAGTIKSGGKTRRAAKMVILDADHPDIEDFVWCKAIEERKARVLADAGFDMDLDGADSFSMQYQNANNSIRVTDDFMHAVIEGRDWDLTARADGSVIRRVPARDLFRQVAHAAWECADPGLQFDTTINKWHTAPVTGRINGSNPCSEYVHLDNSACNLASLNLLTYLRPDDTFDIDSFTSAVEVVFTAQEIIVGNADYPTEKIGDTTRRFRELGLGYANLGALLMACGLPYDSDGGRALAASITSLMTGHAYAVSARTAARMGPFAGFHENADAMIGVLRMHRDAVDTIETGLVPSGLLAAARVAWDEAVELAEQYGVRNSQASVLAPTGCLVGGSLVATERGLLRLAALGDPDGAQWQDLSVAVATDEGPRDAERFYVNGAEPVVAVDTVRGFRIQGTTTHRVKVVDQGTGEWVWRRFADVAAGDLVPLALGSMFGSPVEVPLPELGARSADPAFASAVDAHLEVPSHVTENLAELVGYFNGAGHVHPEGLRLRVAKGDFDVAERLGQQMKEIFGILPKAAPRRGHTELRIDSSRLATWWQAAGFATEMIPSAVLGSNDREIYTAYLRGLFEATGDADAGCPTLRSNSERLVYDVQSLLLHLGMVGAVTVRDRERASASALTLLAHLRMLNASFDRRFMDEIGFMGDRKRAGVDIPSVGSVRAGRRDYIPVTSAEAARLAEGLSDSLRSEFESEVVRGLVTRRTAEAVHVETGDAEIGRLLGFFFDTITDVRLGDDEMTYDISVPDNVTYVANGFVSHNTIGLLMDCDTTGVEPDLGLVKTKKLVGGGTMSIVNQTIPRALTNLGYDQSQIDEIIAYIDEHKSILGAPHLDPAHLPVFACSMGDNTIHYVGHVKMMGAVQPFISGAISKTVNMPEDVTVDDVEQLHIDAWKLGIKAVAIYRDNCKVAQPLSTTKKGAAIEGGDASLPGSPAEAHDRELAEKVAQLESALAQERHRTSETLVVGTVRERMPRSRRSRTFAFRVADCEGYVTVGEYEDGRPGEVFIKVSKQGSTLAGIMDAFSISISLGLQHGVPLSTYVRKYSHMKFEPAGITDDADLRIATSLVDYIFRKIAVDYLSYEERLELGVLTSVERTQPTLPGVEESATPSIGIDGAYEVPSNAPPPPPPAPRAQVTETLARPEQRDAPYCYSCGNVMQRAGSCYVCSSCGTTSGCS